MDDNYIASGAYGEVYKIDNNRAIKKLGSLNELIHEICIYKYIGPCEKITKLLDYNMDDIISFYKNKKNNRKQLNKKNFIINTDLDSKIMSSAYE